MNVRELIERLEGYPDDMPVAYLRDSGDYWGSIIGHEAGGVRVEELVWSEYHRDWKLPKDDADLDDYEKRLNAVVIDDGNMSYGW